MACLIEQINREFPKHILTIEDPIEYAYEEKRACITQREVGAHTRGFSGALRSALREDPDVILVGEMRDLETIQMALAASETGHLVFSTVHTSDASQTVERIIDVFPPAQQAMVRSQLASVLQGVVTQALLPKAAGKGRLAAREIMLMNPAVRTLIRENKTHQLYSVLAAGRGSGMSPLELSLAVKVKQGLVSEDEAYAVANRPSVLRDYLASRALSTTAHGGVFGERMSGAQSNRWAVPFRRKLSATSSGKAASGLEFRRLAICRGRSPKPKSHKHKANTNENTHENKQENGWIHLDRSNRGTRTARHSSRSRSTEVC